MNGRLEIRLLGTPEVQMGGEPVTGFRSSKAQALLYHLVATRRTHARTVLAALFWGDVAEVHARRSLTATLSNLRHLVGDQLVITRETVAFHFGRTTWLDVAEFETGIAAESLPEARQAVLLYRGDFLEGFYIHNAPDFEQWVLMERARLRANMLQGLERLADLEAAQGNLAGAIECLRRALSLEPWREEAHRRLMLFLVQNGQRSAALAQFDLCRQSLAAELEVEPDPDTVALVEQIRAGKIGKVAGEPADRTAMTQPVIRPSLHPAGPLPPHNLPPQPTHFVGREQEMVEIMHRLGDPVCRLLTLVGPGGAGKTRLVLETAQRVVTEARPESPYADGVYFIPLQAVSSPDGVVAAIAEALNLRFYDDSSPRKQLLDTLRNQRMLLLLDNFEELLMAAELVSALLSAAPSVKIVVTSRESLGLQEEWFFPIAGLSLPTAAGTPVTTTLESDAVRLFAQHARRVQPHFSLERELSHVVRICRLVDGMPLAIELASAWLTGLSCHQIVVELERGLDILTGRYQNTPARHRSLRAILEQSWARLPQEQQAIMARLSVLQGEFGQEAALAVAGATFLTLTILVEKSMVHQTVAGRYQIHQLLRQFAAEQNLELAHVRDDHSRYFADFAGRSYELFLSGGYYEAIQAILQELDNIRAAWQWLVHRVEAGQNLEVAEEALARLVTPMNWFFRERTLHWEGKETFQAACSAIKAALYLDNHTNGQKLRLQVLLARLQIGLVHFLYFLGDYQMVERTVEEALPVLHGADLAHEEAAALEVVARSHFRRGNYDTTKALLQRSLALMQQEENKLGVAMVLSTLAATAANEGDYDTAVQLHSKTAAIYRELNYTVGVARSLINLGCTYRWQGNLVAAKRLLEEGHAIAIEGGNLFLIMFATSNLAWTLSELGDYADANHQYHESLAQARELDDQRWIASNLNGISLNYLRLGDLDGAERCAREAMVIAHNLRIDPDTLGSLSYLGQVWAQHGSVEAALRALLYVNRSPAALARDRHLGATLLTELQGKLAPNAVIEIEQWCASKTLDELVQWVATVPQR
jgi:predicted ATPase/DNA-binding SARP family transcriptional activator